MFGPVVTCCLGLFIIWLVFVYFPRAAPPLILYHKAYKPLREVLEGCTTLKEFYFVTPYLWTCHLQFLWIALGLGTNVEVWYRRELLSTVDGGTIVLDWVDNCATITESSPILVVFHGIAGGSSSWYIKNFVSYAVQHSKVDFGSSFRVVVFNRRGCGENVVTSRTPYTHHCDDDCDLVVEHIKKSYPHATALYAVTYSAGANAALKYIGTKGKSPFRAVISTCQGYNLLRGALMLERNAIYSRILAFLLKKNFRLNHSCFFSDPSIDKSRIMRSRSVIEFDQEFTCKVLSTSITHYYQESSCLHYLDQLEVPVVFVHAKDDPIVPMSLVPFQEYFMLPPSVLNWNVVKFIRNWFCCHLYSREVDASRFSQEECHYVFDVDGTEHKTMNLKQNFALVVAEAGGHITWREGWLPLNVSYLDRMTYDLVRSFEVQRLSKTKASNNNYDTNVCRLK